MGFSSKKSGFGEKTTKTKKKPSYTDQQLENIKFEALKMHQKNRLDKAEIAYKKLIKNGVKDLEVFMNLYQIYKQTIRIQDSFIIYKRIIKETNISYSEITIDFLKFIIKTENEDFAKEIVFGNLERNECNEEVISFYAKILLEKNNTNLALDLLKRALKVNPISIPLLSNMGYILQSLKQYNLSIGYYKRALEIKLDDAIILFNIANCFEEISDYESAVDFYKKSLLSNSSNPEAYRALGTIYFNQNEFKLAKNYLNKCLLIDNKNSGALITSLQLSADICEWELVKKYFDSITNLKLTSNISPFPFLAIEDNPMNHLIRARNASQQRFKTKATKINTFSNQKKRIGYFSSDFYNHATMHLMQKVFELHDANYFEIFIYSYGKFQDEVTEKVKKNVYIFRDVSLLTDQEITTLARNDKLDVAIDLKGFTRETRLSIFAHRVASIQISYLGYPGSTGAKFIDYLIADRTLIPKEYEKFYSEKIIYMPHTYQCNDDSKTISNIKLNRKEFDLPEDAIIFTCFNNAFKITEIEFNIWMRLLKEIDKSHLWLYSSNVFMERNLRKEAEKRGIEKSRLTFAKKLPLDKHLARHSLGDIFLDTFNYNAHTTASDALWSGMPLVTYPGKSFSSRVSASLLKSLGLKELICSSEKEYFEKALSIAKDPKLLNQLKEKIKKEKLISPLFDSKRFTRDLENIYTTLVKDLKK